MAVEVDPTFGAGALQETETAHGGRAAGGQQAPASHCHHCHLLHGLQPAWPLGPAATVGTHSVHLIMSQTPEEMIPESNFTLLPVGWVQLFSGRQAFKPAMPLDLKILMMRALPPLLRISLKVLEAQVPDIYFQDNAT